ncbi:pyridoxamine 5'-phosphate oxidase family protein [Streptomyces sp. NPDC041003]|uniref:pyridoxamine 5'-phosphate oxidase family protein n=1 Tax=Streptomyces sp. NPDC041003 TaxID=3155730 RepID=UPI0033F1F866
MSAVNSTPSTRPQQSGASADHVRGRSTARRDTALVALEEAECRTLLGTHGVGRIAVFTPEGPAVLPVNYLIAGPDIAFRTAAEALGQSGRHGGRLRDRQHRRRHRRRLERPCGG